MLKVIQTIKPRTLKLSDVSLSRSNYQFNQSFKKALTTVTKLSIESGDNCYQANGFLKVVGNCIYHAENVTCLELYGVDVDAKMRDKIWLFINLYIFLVCCEVVVIVLVNHLRQCLKVSVPSLMHHLTAYLNLP